jgi:hypothetical protein
MHERIIMGRMTIRQPSCPIDIRWEPRELGSVLDIGRPSIGPFRLPASRRERPQGNRHDNGMTSVRASGYGVGPAPTLELGWREAHDFQVPQGNRSIEHP